MLREQGRFFYFCMNIGIKETSSVGYNEKWYQSSGGKRLSISKRPKMQPLRLMENHNLFIIKKTNDKWKTALRRGNKSEF